MANGCYFYPKHGEIHNWVYQRNLQPDQIHPHHHRSSISRAISSGGTNIDTSSNYQNFILGEKRHSHTLQATHVYHTGHHHHSREHHYIEVYHQVSS